MKIKNHEQHLEMFQRQFLDQTNHQLHLTQSNLIDALPPPQPIPPTNPQVQPLMPAPPSRPGWATTRKYRLTPHHSILQILGGYTITIGLMYLNRVVYFSFFEAIMVVIISLSTRPLEITGSFFIMLGVPISIANYNLDVYVFTYPMIVICYFSRFIFTNRQIRSLLWIVSCVLQFIFGFVLLPAIGRGLPPSLKIVLYYIYPWLLVVVRLLVGLLNQYIADTFPLLLQVSLFIQGLSYGMVLTLRIYNIEFWYLLILLTLEIINTRYQFLLGLLKKALSIKTHSVIQAHCSGHVSMNSLHIIIFIYMVSALSLTTPKFEYNMKRYIENLLNPLIVWVFFVAYELLSIIRLYNNQKLMILGHAEQSYFSIFARALGLSLGLWFFYLGLGVPTLIFY